jgi:hypothetical protein
MTSATERDGGAAPVNQRDAAFSGLLQRIRSEFLEMPGLRLTLPQAQRLWGLDASTCEAALRQLLETKFLAMNGIRYSRLSDGSGISFPPVRMAKANLRNEGSTGQSPYTSSSGPEATGAPTISSTPRRIPAM